MDPFSSNSINDPESFLSLRSTASSSKIKSDNESKEIPKSNSNQFNVHSSEHTQNKTKKSHVDPQLDVFVFLPWILKTIACFLVLFVIIISIKSSFQTLLQRSGQVGTDINSLCSKPSVENLELCQPADIGFSKFIWFITDGFPFGLQKALIENYKDHSQSYLVNIPGTKYSHAIYTSWLTGQLPTNYQGKPALGDTILKSFLRSYSSSVSSQKLNETNFWNQVFDNSSPLTYWGPSWSFLEMVGKEVWKEQFKAIHLYPEPHAADFKSTYPSLFHPISFNNSVNSSDSTDSIESKKDIEIYSEPLHPVFETLQENGLSMIAHSGIFDHIQHSESQIHIYSPSLFDFGSISNANPLKSPAPQDYMFFEDYPNCVTQTVFEFAKSTNDRLNLVKEFIDKNPEYVLILSSDHGVDDVTSLHGESIYPNAGAFTIYNPRIPPTLSPQWIDIVDVAPMLSQLFDVDIPFNSIGYSPLSGFSQSDTLKRLSKSVQQLNLLSKFKNLDQISFDKSDLSDPELLLSHVSTLKHNLFSFVKPSNKLLVLALSLFIVSSLVFLFISGNPLYSLLYFGPLPTGLILFCWWKYKTYFPQVIIFYAFYVVLLCSLQFYEGKYYFKLLWSSLSHDKKFYSIHSRVYDYLQKHSQFSDQSNTLHQPFYPFKSSKDSLILFDICVYQSKFLQRNVFLYRKFQNNQKFLFYMSVFVFLSTLALVFLFIDDSSSWNFPVKIFSLFQIPLNYFPFFNLFTHIGFVCIIEHHVSGYYRVNEFFHLFLTGFLLFDYTRNIPQFFGIYHFHFIGFFLYLGIFLLFLYSIVQSFVESQSSLDIGINWARHFITPFLMLLWFVWSTTPWLRIYYILLCGFFWILFYGPCLQKTSNPLFLTTFGISLSLLSLSYFTFSVPTLTVVPTSGKIGLESDSIYPMLSASLMACHKFGGGLISLLFILNYYPKSSVPPSNVQVFEDLEMGESVSNPLLNTQITSPIASVNSIRSHPDESSNVDTVNEQTGVTIKQALSLFTLFCTLFSSGFLGFLLTLNVYTKAHTFEEPFVLSFFFGAFCVLIVFFTLLSCISILFDQLIRLFSLKKQKMYF